jgi:hypothetical protein
VIDWQVRIDGKDPPGWDQHRDGCWFPDFAYQAYLLPDFEADDSPIDEYGGTEFRAADLQKLKTRLVAARERIKAKPARWTVTDWSSGKPHEMPLDRKTALALLDRTPEMIDFALAQGGTIVFRGD